MDEDERVSFARVAYGEREDYALGKEVYLRCAGVHNYEVAAIFDTGMK